VALDLTNITAALSALGSLIGLANKANTVEFNQKLIEVQKVLIAIQGDFTKLSDENSQLKDELERERSYVFHHSVSWKQRPDGTQDGPFCPFCLSKGTVLPLRARRRAQSGGITFECIEDHTVGALRDRVVYVLPEDLIPKDRYTLPV